MATIKRPLSVAERANPDAVFAIEQSTLLDQQSRALVELMHGKPFHAPVDAPTRILDVGCGTASMTVLLARRFPQAQVVGIDVNAITGTYDLPSNIALVQGDIIGLAGVHALLQHSSFDYIFSRGLVAGIKDWPFFLSVLHLLLRRGGWLELQEGEFCFRSRHAAHEVVSDAWRWRHVVLSAFSSAGLDFLVCDHLGRDLRDAGFVDVDDAQHPYLCSDQVWDEAPHAHQMGIYGAMECRRMPAMVETFLQGHFSSEQTAAVKQEVLDTVCNERDPKVTRVMSFWGRKAS